MIPKVNTGKITIQKWLDLKKSEHDVPLSVGQNNLLKSVADSLNKTEKTNSALNFMYGLIEQFAGEKLWLNSHNSVVKLCNNELRIIPYEQKLFEGEDITVSFIG